MTARCPSRTRSAITAITSALSAIALALFAAAGALGASRVYRNDAWRIASFETPRGWTPAPQIPWPGVLLSTSGTVGSPSDGEKLVLSAQRVAPGQDAVSLAADARAVLARQGYGEPKVSERTPGTGGDQRCLLEATFDHGKQVMHQLYAVSGDVAIVVTVTAPIAISQRAQHDFDSASTSLTLSPPGPVPTPPPAAMMAPDGGA